MGQQRSLQQLILREIQEGQLRDANNSQEITKLLRYYAATMCIYFFALLMNFWLYSNSMIILFGVVGLGVFAIAYYISYLNKIKASVTLMYIMTLAYVVSFIYVFGWKSGVQIFLFGAMMLILISEYISREFKVVSSIFICGLRFVLFHLSQKYGSLYIMNDHAVMYLEVINIVTIFIVLSLCIIIFSEQAYSMERKLLMYNRKLAYLASEDPVTGLNNRRSILEYLEKAVLTDNPKLKKQICVAMGDIDFFKRINDRYGHECGDIVLRQLSNKFQKFMVNKGKVGRWGGEEFLFVFENMSGQEIYGKLQELSDEIRNMEFVYKDDNIHLTVTFGLTEFDYQKGLDAVINEADQRLYLGKEAGRDRIIYHEEV